MEPLVRVSRSELRAAAKAGFHRCADGRSVIITSYRPGCSARPLRPGHVRESFVAAATLAALLSLAAPASAACVRARILSALTSAESHAGNAWLGALLVSGLARRPLFHARAPQLMPRDKRRLVRAEPVAPRKFDLPSPSSLARPGGGLLRCEG